MCLTYIDNISQISDYSKANFVASVLTSWQFDVLVAYLQRHKMDHGILVIEPIPFVEDVKFRLSDKNVLPYSNLFDEIYFCKRRTPPYQWRNLICFLFAKKKIQPLIFLRPLSNLSLRMISNIVRPWRAIRYVALDEGLSSYFSLYDSLRLMYKKKSQVITKWLIQSIFNLIGNIYVNREQSFGLFSQEKGTLVPNSCFCEAMRELYQGRVNHNQSCGTSVLLFKDYKVVPDENILPLWKSILILLDSMDVNIVIKKHPSDTDNSFDREMQQSCPKVKVINSIISGEELVAQYNPILIIGGYTTVVFSASLIYGIPAISFSSLYLKQNMVNGEMKANITHFADVLAKYIIFCEDEEYLKKYIIKIIQK